MATSMLKQAVTSIATELRTIPFVWANAATLNVLPTPKVFPDSLFQFVAVFNNQIKGQLEGSEIPRDYPQCYIQPILGKATNLGLGVSMYENCIFRIHIADWMLDAGDGTLDQNLQVIDYRDLVKTTLNNFFPLYCGLLTDVEEVEDFDHEGVYHYTIDYLCAFCDSKGGPLDPDQTKIIYVDNIGVQETIEFNGEPTPPVLLIFKWQPCVIYVNIVTTVDPAATQTLANGVVIRLQYALNMDGSLTIPYLVSIAGVTVLTPFLVDNNSIEDMPYDGTTGTFTPTPIGEFIPDVNQCAFNASLPFYQP